MIKGNAKTDNPLATLTKMGATGEASKSAIVFRHGDKLYIVDGTPPERCASGRERLPKQLAQQLHEEFPRQLRHSLQV